MMDIHIQFTISMGIVCNSSIIARKFKQLFSVADQALYMAKNQGKNQIVSLSNMNCKVNNSPILLREGWVLFWCACFLVYIIFTRFAVGFTLSGLFTRFPQHKNPEA